MSEPKIAEKAPAKMELEPGTYWWCTCGHSADKTFCDGAHKVAPGFKPLKVVIEEKKTVYLCNCKHTKGQPFCDGSHGKL